MSFAVMSSALQAQPAHQDSIGPVIQMDEVVVTATRSARTLESIPVPATVIRKQAITEQGARRLTDVLSEHPGLMLQSDHGVGLQMQGLGPEYTLILLDGQPMIGRTAGTFDLSRLTVNNIRRIEVIRGPSSSLYGSDALAGVVNVITEDPQRPVAADIKTQVGSNGLVDLSGRIGGVRGPLSASLFINRYSSNGYDLTPDSHAPTVPGFVDYTTRGEASYALSSNLDASLRARVARQMQQSTTEVSGESELFSDHARRTDWNIGPRMTYSIRPGMQLEAEVYAAGFHTRSVLRGEQSGAELTNTFYDQRYSKGNIQFQGALSGTHLLTAGAGYKIETVSADRLDTERSGGFVYLQDEWAPVSWLDLVPSVRLDVHSDYPTRVSPKLAALARPIDGLRVRASVGSGYKAPAFRQLYLNFTNPQVGYSVFGAESAAEELQRLEAQGRIQTYLRPLSALTGSLSAERSLSFNVGVDADVLSWLTVRANLYHNEVDGLIDTQPVARKDNGQQVFSYFNLNDVFTRGLEATVEIHPTEPLELALSYTWLDARNRAVLQALREGSIYRRTSDGRDVRVPVSSYGGLPNRSAHSGAARLTYRLSSFGLTVSTSAEYRGKFGFADRNGNSIIDAPREYAPGYLSCDVTFTKTLLDGHALQFGGRNLFGYTDPQHVPFLPGRQLFAGVNLRFEK